MKNLILFLTATALTGYAVSQTPDDPPRCTTQRECEVMWSDAQEAIGLVSQMRIRLATDTRIETFGPTTYGRVGALVTKVPAGEKDYEIRIRLECYRSTPCGDLQASGARLFYSMLQRPKSTGSPPSEPAASDAKK